MSFSRACALGLAFSAVTFAAQAQIFGADEPFTGPQGVYLRGEVGWSHLNGEKGTGSGNGNPLQFNSSESEGLIGGGALGYKIDQLRVELGLDFSGYDVSSISVGNDGGLGARLGGPSLTGATSNPSGSVHTVAGMVNALWDMRTGTPFVPYLGIGVGVASVKLDNFMVGGKPLSNSSDMVFAYQPIVGVKYFLTTNLALGLEYRYFATVQPTFKDSSGRSFTGRIESHNVIGSLTYHFGSAPTPVASVAQAAPLAVAEINPAAGPPPAAVRASQAFVIYFDLGRATLTPQAMKTADDAAAAFLQNKATRIQVAGYTDASGTTTYDEALSHRRAEVVRDYLVRRGVPVSEMEVSWHGKSDPAVQTANGRPEARNRRVEIIIP